MVRMSLMLSLLCNGYYKLVTISGNSAANFGLNSSVMGTKIHSTDGLDRLLHQMNDAHFRA